MSESRHRWMHKDAAQASKPSSSTVTACYLPTASRLDRHCHHCHRSHLEVSRRQLGAPLHEVVLLRQLPVPTRKRARLLWRCRRRSRCLLLPPLPLLLLLLLLR